MDVNWEQRYREGDTPWEKGAAHPALVQWLNGHSLPGRVLVPGCGSGNDVRALAASGSEPLGLDLAASAVAAARKFPRTGRERYVHGDLFATPDEWDQTFDGVFEHTCFCAISPDRRSAYVEAVAKLLKPGGHLLAIFFLNPDLDADEDGPPFGITGAGLDELFSPHFQLLEEQRGFATHPGREGREIFRLLARVDRA